MMRARHAKLLALWLFSGSEPKFLLAQSSPPVHALGPLLAITSEPLAAVSQVRAISGGRVIVNDNTGRRVLMFDSTLQHFTVIADTTSATGNSYSSRAGGLIAYHGDSTLFVDPKSVSMFVIAPSGRIVKTLAAPPYSASGNYLIGGLYGTPGLDARGRLVFHTSILKPADMTTDVHLGPDSSLIMRFDFVSRVVDTVAKRGVPVSRFLSYERVINGQLRGMIETIFDPIPWTDDWAVLSDGTIAVVRGRDYRVDFIAGDRSVTSGPKVPFAWQRLTEDDKAAILDSVRTGMDKARDARRDSLEKEGYYPPGPRPAPLPYRFVALNEMPDYRPAFQTAAARGDADGHLWIRTSVTSNGGVVYDVINRDGVLIDRVQIPPGRVIAGFGPGGIVYMGVLDGTIARLERARSPVFAK
jgi:hypothetical protein